MPTHLVPSILPFCLLACSVFSLIISIKVLLSKKPGYIYWGSINLLLASVCFFFGGSQFIETPLSFPSYEWHWCFWTLFGPLFFQGLSTALNLPGLSKSRFLLYLFIPLGISVWLIPDFGHSIEKVSEIYATEQIWNLSPQSVEIVLWKVLAMVYMSIFMASMYSRIQSKRISLKSFNSDSKLLQMERIETQISLLIMSVMAFLIFYFLTLPIQELYYMYELAFIGIFACMAGGFTWWINKYFDFRTKVEEIAPLHLLEAITNDTRVEGETYLLRIQLLMNRKKPFKDPHLSIFSLCNDLGMLPDHLQSVIHYHFDMNFFDFVNYFRVKEVKKQLTSNHAPDFDAICEDAGFSSQTELIRVFKYFLGTNPHKFHRMLMRKEQTDSLFTKLLAPKGTMPL